MSRLTIRLDPRLLDRLTERATATETTLSAYIRDLVARDMGLDPGGYHARFDELHATAIQTLSIIAASVAGTAPDLLEQGMADARILLRDRGLLDLEADQ